MDGAEAKDSGEKCKIEDPRKPNKEGNITRIPHEAHHSAVT
jgi:hypothetical protein